MAGHVRRIVAVVAGLAALSTGALACSEESAAAQAEQLILGAADATFAQGTAQVLVTLDGLGDADGEGQVDFENGQSQVDVDVDGQPTSVIVDGVDTYVGLGDTFTQDLDDLPDLGTILIFLQPLQALQILNGAQGGDDIEIVGDEDIDGVAVTHYRVVVDLQAALDSLDGDARRALQDAIDRLGLDQLSVDVWLDDNGVVRRLVSDFPLPNGDTVTLRLDLSDFGEPVRIRIPRPREVLAGEAFLLATADLSGTWTGTTTTVSATDTVQWPLNEPIEIELDMTCAPDGSCVNAVSGNTWETAGGGAFTIAATEELTCVDTVTQEPGVPGGFVEEYESTWVVTAQEDGVATEMTATGTVTGRVTPIGQAENCTMPQGGLQGSAQRESVATRTG